MISPGEGHGVRSGRRRHREWRSHDNIVVSQMSLERIILPLRNEALELVLLRRMVCGIRQARWIRHHHRCISLKSASVSYGRCRAHSAGKFNFLFLPTSNNDSRPFISYPNSTARLRRHCGRDPNREGDVVCENSECPRFSPRRILRCQVICFTV